MLKLLDGNKRLIVVLGFIISGFVAVLTGQDVSQWLDLGLRTFGWMDPGVIAVAKEMATQIVPLLFAIWAALHALWKMWQQHRAGATPTELLSSTGYVKEALDAGRISLGEHGPVIRG